MIQVLNEDAKSVDWWFIYKTPEYSGSKDNLGYDYLYYDADGKELVLSEYKLNETKGALSYTLDNIFKNKSKETGYVVYNDEHTDEDRNDNRRGHCKGILVFNKEEDQAVFMLHSTPRFPAKNETTLPEREKKYGQTFICITLSGYAEINKIASQMLNQQNPQVLDESSYMPDSISKNDAIYKLFKGDSFEQSKQPETICITSKAGKEFKLIAKSKSWGEDFWIDLVSPELDEDLIVESWRRGTVPPAEDATSSEEDEDVITIKFYKKDAYDFEWEYTKDHAKWATSIANKTSKKQWVCVADLNRMVSQEKRGGGTLCFEEQNLWKALQKAEEKLHEQGKK
ncbi:deoxyribonuclease II family protein [Aquimarina sp. 2201CG5-10]|uniref:deoxyribonuclease II family protein n=1 Tax=Aquimarina callyspongiae TaxID=3098150 RepID=UPI002AB331A3|nr:deoxyribonuclease II family protein [Aquimarina sp. 2201CG5-10]MDY8138722.1 deoxyribonuclease II family protein [Aquimarina sp. 2201CG5-10]